MLRCGVELVEMFGEVRICVLNLQVHIVGGVFGWIEFPRIAIDFLAFRVQGGMIEPRVVEL